jgi:hypothetical protein
VTTAPIVIVEDVSTAGALVYWRLSGSIWLSELQAAWAKTLASYGLANRPEMLPAATSPATSFTRAVKAHGDARTLVRSLGRSSYVIVAERVANRAETHPNEPVEYRVDLQVSLDAVGRVVFKPAEHPKRKQILLDYEKGLDELTSNDVGSWLSDMVRRSDGVALRESGGFYFIPREKLDGPLGWRSVSRTIQSCSAHRCFEIPAMRTVDVLDSIVDALGQEAAAEAARLEAEVLEHVEGRTKLGAKALGSRADQCAAIAAKLGRYEAILGRQVSKLVDKIDEVKAQLTAAALAAQLEPEEKAS